MINPSGNDPVIMAATTCATSQPPPPAMPPDNPDTDNRQNFTPDLGTIQYLYIFIRFVSPANTNMQPETCEVCGLYLEIPPYSPSDAPWRYCVFAERSLTMIRAFQTK